MVPSYQELIGKSFGYMQALGKDKPDLMGKFQAFEHAAGGNGALDAKTKELISLALAVGARCDACIGYHAKQLVGMGLTRAELEDALGVCITMGGGPSLMYATGALAAYEEFGGEKAA